MALSIADVSPQHPIVNVGGLRARVVTLTFDDNYPVGGESLTPADLGLAEIYAVVPLPDAAGGAKGFVFQYDYTNSKLMAFDEGAVADAPLTELADTSGDLTDDVVRCLVLGV